MKYFCWYNEFRYSSLHHFLLPIENFNKNPPATHYNQKAEFHSNINGLFIGADWDLLGKLQKIFHAEIFKFHIHVQGNIQTPGEIKIIIENLLDENCKVINKDQINFI